MTARDRAKLLKLWEQLATISVTGAEFLSTGTPAFAVAVVPEVVAQSGDGAVRYFIDVKPGPQRGNPDDAWDVVYSVIEQADVTSWRPYEGGIRIRP